MSKKDWDSTIEQHQKSGDVKKLITALEDIELQCGATIPQPTLFPYYGLLIASYIVDGDLNSARFTWKRTHEQAKKQDKEIAQVWEVGRALWKKEFGKLPKLLATQWSPQVAQQMTLFASSLEQTVMRYVALAYKNLSVKDLAGYLDTSEANAITAAQNAKWKVTEKLVEPTEVTTRQERYTDLTQLRQLTEYIGSLE